MRGELELQHGFEESRTAPVLHGVNAAADLFRRHGFETSQV